MKSKQYLLTSTSLAFLSCNTTVRKVQNRRNYSNLNTSEVLEGSYDTTEEKCIKTYRSERFKKISKNSNNQSKSLATIPFHSSNKGFTKHREAPQIVGFKENLQIFSTFYLRIAKKRTFTTTFTTPFEVNFDGYTENMKF